jgi:hypothetical protein
MTDEEKKAEEDKAKQESQMFTKEEVTAILAEREQALEKRILEGVNKAITAREARAQKPADAKLADAAGNTDPRLARMLEEMDQVKQQLDSERKARLDAEQSRARESAKSMLERELTSKGITGARLRAVVNDMMASGAFALDETGAPVMRVTRARVRGESPKDLTHRNVTEGVADWLQTDDAKEFLPAPNPAAQARVGNAGKRPSDGSATKKYDLGTEDGAVEAAVALLGDA